MEPIFAAISVALSAGATTAERQRGALLCRAIADQLDPRPGVATTPASAPRATAAAAPPVVAPAQVAPDLAVATAPPPNPFAGLTADQIFDLAITKLRGAVGDPDVPPAPLGTPFRIPLVPVPRLR